MSEEAYKYAAFISYSHRDRQWGAWLHKSLESYRVPKRFVGTAGKHGTVPRRLFPIFRDREELPSSSSLNQEISEALASTDKLIVVCTPNAAQSRWVNQEVLAFKRSGRGDRIFPIIAEGEPNSGKIDGPLAQQECFPEALKYVLDAAGAPTSALANPSAADARAHGDGRRDARLKLLAGLLGVDYAVLKQREFEAQRAARRRQFALGGVILAAFLGLAAYFLVSQTQIARADQLVAEAQSALAQRDYPHAEIAAAKALSYRDTRETRELLLTARLAGVSLLARGPRETDDALNMLSADGEAVATARRAGDGYEIAVRATTADAQTSWRVALPRSAGEPDTMAVSGPSPGGGRFLAAAWPDVSAETQFHVGVWRVAEDASAPRLVELIDPQGHCRNTKRVPSLAFSPVSPWLATSSEDGRICIWDVSGAHARLLWERTDAHYPDVHGIAFSRDGTRLASGGGDYLAKVWDVTAAVGEAVQHPDAPYTPHQVDPIYTLSGHNDSVFAVAFDATGSRLATGGYDRTIRVWDLGLKGAPTVATLTGHEGTILTLAYSEDGTLLASGGSDETARLWNPQLGRLMNTFRSDDGVVRSVAFPDFNASYRIAGEGGWSAWSLRGGDLIERLWAGGATVGAIAFDPTSHAIAVGGGGDGGKIRIWDRGYHPLQVLDPHSEDEYINGIAFSSDGRWLAAGGGERVVHIWDQRSGWAPVTPHDVSALHHDGGDIWGLCFDPRGQWLASSNQHSDQAPNDIRIRRWRTGDWSMLDQTKPLDDQVYALACTSDGRWIASGDSRARVAIRETGHLQQMAQTINVRHGEVNVWSLSLSDAPLAVYSGNSDGRVHRWTLPDAAHPQGEQAATSDADARVNPTINSVAYDRRHGWVAAGGVGPSVEIYDSNLRHIYSLRGHDGTIWWVAFDTDGSRLAYGGLDGIVRVVDIAQMLRLDTISPAQAYADSHRAVGLSVLVCGGQTAITTRAAC
jgi:WD40 repeat protein